MLISFQTRAELLAGATADGWGERRATELRAILDRTPTIGVDDEVIDAHATLYAECRRIGTRPSRQAPHRRPMDRGLRDREGSPACLAGDGIYRDAPEPRRRSN
ncbi:MAG: hypothetical protein WKF76_09545 [Nocardioidaceae bacterium]